MRITLPYTVFARKLASGRTVYYYQYRLSNGTRSPAYSTGCDTLSKAKRIVQKLYNDGKFDCSNSMTFNTFTKNFFSHDSDYYKWKLVNNQKVTDETLLSYDKFLRNQLMPFFTGFNLSQINKDVVKQWIIWSSDKWSAKTVNNAQTTLNLILNSAVDKSLINENPLKGLCFRKTEKKQRTLLTIDEIRFIYHSEWTNPIYRKMFLLTVITGMRIGEVIGLTDNDIEPHCLNVRHTYSRNFGLGETTKTKLNRYVPIPDGFNLPHKDGWIFADRDDGKPVDLLRFFGNFSRLIDRLGIKRKERGITVHTLRNFFISYLQSENITESKIRAVVGHKDSSMTGLYTYWTPEMFPEVYDAQKKLYEYITKE